MMGVAILIVPMLLFLLLPFAFLAIAGFVARRFGRSKGAARIAAGLVLVGLLAYPAFEGARLVVLAQRCDAYSPSREPPVTTAPAPLLILREFGGSGIQVNFTPRAEFYNPEQVRHVGFAASGLSCGYDRAACADLAAGGIPYTIEASLPHRPADAGWLDPDVATLRILDHATGRVLRERKDYVVGGFAGAYHGLLTGHPGRVSCGYVDEHLGAFRPKGGVERQRAYERADNRFIESAFPWLQTRPDGCEDQTGPIYSVACEP
jgi:hypothetical protein